MYLIYLVYIIYIILGPTTMFFQAVYLILTSVTRVTLVLACNSHRNGERFAIHHT